MFAEIADVIQPRYTEPEAIFGLQRYIKSLKKLGEIARQHPDLLVLPAHRLFYKSQWNRIDLADRVNELVQHHIDRCGAILTILCTGSKSADEIARAHFEEKLLEGFGSMMAANEIVSHCELLIKSGDVVSAAGNTYGATGSTHFETYIKALRSEY